MSEGLSSSPIEVFSVPNWNIIHESLVKGFDEIFPDIGEEINSPDRYWLDHGILGKKTRKTQLIITRALIRDSFLAFIEPILFDLYYNEQNWNTKTYPMNEYMGSIALYLVSGIRKEYPNVDNSGYLKYYPLWILWNEYVPENQKVKFPKNIFMEISESGAMAGRGNFFLEIKFTEKVPAIEQTPEIITNTSGSVDFLLQHPADAFNAYLESLMIPGETKDIMGETYTSDYLKHIRITMVNRIWQDIYQAMQEPDKDWHFEYRESDLASILGERSDSERIARANELLKLAFPAVHIVLSPNRPHPGEYDPAIVIDVRSKSRGGKRIVEQEARHMRHYEYLAFPLGCKRTESRDVTTA